MTTLLKNTKKLNERPREIEDDILISEQKIIRTLGDTYVKTGNQDNSLDFYSQLDGKYLTKNILLKIIHLPSTIDSWYRVINILLKYVILDKICPKSHTHPCTKI